MAISLPSWKVARVERDAESNLMTINLKGAVGFKVVVEIPDYPLSEKAKRELLPVMREGNIDVSAIEEGARRLETRLQEEGYFFAEITSICKVTPPIPVAGINRRCGDLRKSESGSVERPFGGDYLPDRERPTVSSGRYPDHWNRQTRPRRCRGGPEESEGERDWSDSVPGLWPRLHESRSTGAGSTNH